jgi:hypothetical protein
MLNKKKILSIASAGLALMAITGSVYAATATPSPSDATPPTATNQVQEKHDHSNQELLTLLGIDATTLKQDFKAGQSLADIAAAKGVNEQQVIDLLVNQESQKMDQKVTSGKLTQAQADQKKAKLADEIKKRVERKGEFGGEHRRGHKEGGLKDVATILNTAPKDLETQLKAGQTIAQIAQAKGIAESDLINQLLQKDKDRLTKMVENTWQPKDDGENKGSDSTSTPNAATQPTANSVAPATTNSVTATDNNATTGTSNTNQ